MPIKQIVNNNVKKYSHFYFKRDVLTFWLSVSVTHLPCVQAFCQVALAWGEKFFHSSLELWLEILHSHPNWRFHLHGFSLSSLNGSFRSGKRMSTSFKRIFGSFVKRNLWKDWGMHFSNAGAELCIFARYGVRHKNSQMNGFSFRNPWR